MSLTVRSPPSLRAQKRAVLRRRGEIKELAKGIGADAVLECVGTQESMMQALGSVRPGGLVSYVGVRTESS